MGQAGAPPGPGPPAGVVPWLGAQPAEGTRRRPPSRPPPQPPSPAAATAGGGVRGRSGPRLALLQVPGEPILQGMGEAAGPHFPWKGNALGCARFPGSAGGRAASAWQGHPLPPPGALPLCLSAAPLLPDKWLEAGNWTRSWGAALVREARRGRLEAGRLRGSPAGAGAVGDVLTSCQRKELDASKALFTAGLCLLQS